MKHKDPLAIPEDEEARPRDGTPIPAWLLFIGLLTVEYLVVSYRIDAQDLLKPAGLDSWLGEIGTTAPLALIIVAATYLAGGRGARDALRVLRSFSSSRGARVVFGGLHIVLVGTWLYLTTQITGEAVGESLVRSRQMALTWMGLVMTSTLALVPALWAPGRLWQALRLARWGVAVGFGVGLLAWIGGLLSTLLWPHLARLTLELVHALLSLIAADPVAVPDEALVGTARFYVRIAPVCSGIEGIGLMLVFMGAYLHHSRAELRWPHAFMLLPISVVAIWLLNIVRITALVAVGTWVSAGVALGGFHSKAGWVLFTGVALGGVAATQRLALFRRVERRDSQAEAPSEITSNPVAPYLVPMLAVLAVALLTGLAASGLDLLYFLRVLAAVIAIWVYRRSYARPDLQKPWLALGVGLAVAVVWILGSRGEAREGTLLVTGELDTLSPVVAALWVSARAVGSAVTTPVVEELAFRGYLMRRFAARDFEQVSYRSVGWAALAASSVAFGLMHSQWLLGILAGVAYGSVTMARGKLSDAVVAHATTNAILVAWVLATGDWSLLS